MKDSNDSQLLNILHLYKTFDGNLNTIHVINNVNFSFYINEIVVILGPSGCGKTTLLNIIAGLDNDYEGYVDIDKSLHNTGYMFQTPSLIPWRTVLKNITLGNEIRNNYREGVKRYNIKELVSRYGLEDFLHSYPKVLSQGMQQRVSLLRLLLYGANLLLLDEPFSKIDFMMKRVLYKDIHNLVKDDGATIILVTHDVEEAVLLADKIVVLSARPATVINEIEINVSREDRLGGKYYAMEKMNDYKRMIWSSFKELNKETNGY